MAESIRVQDQVWIYRADPDLISHCPPKLRAEIEERNTYLDRVAALTDDDVQWLTGHGWKL